MRKGDYGHKLYFTITNKTSGEPVDLTTITSVDLNTTIAGEDYTYTCTVENATAGIVSYTTEDGFLPDTGHLEMEVVIENDTTHLTTDTIRECVTEPLPGATP